MTLGIQAKKPTLLIKTMFGDNIKFTHPPKFHALYQVQKPTIYVALLISQHTQTPNSEISFTIIPNWLKGGLD